MNASPSSSSSRPGPSSGLARVLQDLSRRVLALAWARGLALLALIFLGAALVRGALDYWLQLAWPVRAVFLAADLALASWVGWRHFLSPWRRRLGPEGAALRLQAAFPSLGSRLIAAVQLPAQAADGRASAEIVGHVVEDAERRLGELPWREAAPVRPTVRPVGSAVAVALLFVFAWVAFADPAPQLLRRVWLSTEAAYTRTRLAVEPGDVDIALGAPVALLARTGGALPASATFELRASGGDSRFVPVERDAARPGEFPLPIDNVRQTFRYRVTAGDARSPWRTVRVLPPPVLDSLTFTIEPPAYTGLPVVRTDGDVLEVPAGSTLRVEGRALDALDSARIELWNSAADAEPAATLPTDLAPPDRFTGLVPGDSLPGALSVRLRGTNGMVSQDDARRRLRLVPDLPPLVELSAYPPDGALAVPTQPLRLRGRIADDHGVTSLVLRWRLERPGQDALEGAHPLDLPMTPVRLADFEADQSLDPRALPGSTLVWWLEATDQYPHRDAPAATPRRSLRLVTPEEKIAATFEQVRAQSALLDELGRAQDALGESLGRSLQTRQP